MRKKFSIYYPKDHEDPNLAGTKYKPKTNKMVVMNNDGVFFLYTNERYYPYLEKLSDVLPKYDVIWKD